MPTPPKTAAPVTGVCTARALKSSRICAASSRVGASTSARVVRRGLSISRLRIGSRNAAVLPLPVCAVAMTSLPSKRRRNRLGLDRGGADEPELLDALEQRRVKSELGEWHR